MGWRLWSGEVLYLGDTFSVSRSSAMGHVTQTYLKVLLYGLQFVAYGLIVALYGYGKMSVPGMLLGGMAGVMLAVFIAVGVKRFLEWHEKLLGQYLGLRKQLEKVPFEDTPQIRGITDVNLFYYISLVIIIIEIQFIYFLYFESFREYLHTDHVYISSMVSVLFCEDYTAAFRFELCVYNLIAVYVFVKALFFLVVFARLQKSHIDALINFCKIRIGLFGGIALFVAVILFVVFMEGLYFYSNIEGYEYDIFGGGSLILMYIPIMFYVVFSVLVVFLMVRARSSSLV